MLHASSATPEVIDLEMSDLEYLELLALGRDPVREQSYVHELLSYQFAPETARQVAPLFEKAERTLAEKILVGQAIRQIWDLLSTPDYWQARRSR